jgi:hypothetical protein
MIADGPTSYERRDGWGRMVLARRVDDQFVETSAVQFAD